MIADVLAKERVELIQTTDTLTMPEISRLMTLFQVTDDWIMDIGSQALQKNHAITLRLQLHRFGKYYFDIGERNKSKLAVSLYDTTFFAESVGLTPEQVYTIQAVLTYFLRVIITHEDLDACELKLYENGIHLMPPIPDLQAFLTLSKA